MAKATPPQPAYGTEPSYDGPPIHQLVRQDRRGLYRRESIDLATGQIDTDPTTGAVRFDEMVQSTSAHMALARKGWRLVRLVP